DEPVRCEQLALLLALRKRGKGYLSGKVLGVRLSQEILVGELLVEAALDDDQHFLACSGVTLCQRDHGASERGPVLLSRQHGCGLPQPPNERAAHAWSERSERAVEPILQVHPVIATP